MINDKKFKIVIYWSPNSAPSAPDSAPSAPDSAPSAPESLVHSF
jgi:hypothetical protein